MSEILFYYKRPDPVTWVYLSSLLTIGLFFVFHRVWSVRNVDLFLILLLAPGLLMVQEGRRRQLLVLQSSDAAAVEINEGAPDVAADDVPLEGGDDAVAADGDGASDAPLAAGDGGAVEMSESERREANERATARRKEALQIELRGFIWLLGVSLLLLIRMLIDPAMVRRPLLDPNLTLGGLNFIGVALFIFLMANVITSTPVLQLQQGPRLGPGYALLDMLPAIPTTPLTDAQIGRMQAGMYVLIARILAIAAGAAVVIGIILVGYRHFNNLRAGVGCAVLYLLLPYTAQMTGRVSHILPAAMLIWALLFYRRPILSGIFVGLSAGLVYYPLFLLPLWISFYWQRGLGRFCGGVTVTLIALATLLAFGSDSSAVEDLRQMFGLWLPAIEGLGGVWGLGWNPVWRIPVLAGFFILSFLFAFWPGQKNLGTLMSSSAAIMLGAQFWHGYGGGMYMAWYLPLVLLTVFRPNLEDRVALKVIGNGRTARSAAQPTESEAA